MSEAPPAVGARHAETPEQPPQTGWQEPDPKPRLAPMGSGDQALRILMVEDDFQIAKPVRNALRREGYDVRHCETAQKALDSMRSWQPDLILLDLWLPDGDGRDIARQIRATSDVPLVMVSARGEETDRVTGLELGADDYIVKPFSLPELLSRVRAVLRRSRPRGSWGEQRLQHGPIVLDLEERKALLSGQQIDLSNKEFEVLKILMERPGKIVRRTELAMAVWGTTAQGAGKTIDVHLSWLRNKLGDDPREPRFIETVRRVGFRLITTD
jgi:two-component system, OmpR family, response regulator RegX3